MKQITGYNSEKLSTENYFACIDAFYITNWINFVSRYHAHSHIEIMYVEKGSCTIDIGESLYHFKRGEFIIINANTYHKLLVENEPCQIINLEFHFQSITDDLLSFSSIIRQSRYMMGLL
ncbi:MAG: cupin domain-containing protein, partial [Eubacteriales bacterium]